MKLFKKKRYKEVKVYNLKIVYKDGIVKSFTAEHPYYMANIYSKFVYQKQPIINYKYRNGYLCIIRSEVSRMEFYWQNEKVKE